MPSTFAISCGSATTAVVPSGSTSRANASGSSLVDSRCMCASTKPGTTYRPEASTVSRAVVGARPEGPARDVPVRDRDVDLEPLAREDGEDASAADDEVGRLVAAGDRDPSGQAAESIYCERTVLSAVEVLTPRTLDEALRMRADAGARPVQGGTDVMVELNFDRARPARS